MLERIKLIVATYKIYLLFIVVVERRGECFPRFVEDLINAL